MARRTADAARGLAAHLGSLPRLAETMGALVGGGFSAQAGPIGEAVEGTPIVWVRAADGRGFAVGVDGVLAGVLAAAVLGQVAPEEAAAPRDPTPVERGIVCFLVAALVEGRGLSVTLDAAAPPPGSLALPIRCALGARSGVVRVWVPLDFARAPAAVTGSPDRIAALRIPLVLARGRAHIAVPRIAALRPRDVVLLGDEPEIRVARGGFACRLEAGALRILAPYQRGVAMNEALARDLPVELVCELGRTTLSAKEVLELAPGAIVTLPDKVGATVALTAGGRTVARGELLDVDGQVGVRIVEVT